MMLSLPVPPVVLGVLPMWVHPIWVIGMGVAVAVLLLLAIYGAASAALPRIGVRLRDLAWDSIASPLFWAAAAVAVLALAITPWGVVPAAGGNVLVRYGSGLLGLLWPVEGSDYADRLMVWWSAGVVLSVTGLMALLHFGMPRISAIAATTMREGMSQPLFWTSVAVGSAAIFLFNWIPFNTFGEDVKMVKESGLTLITVLAMFQAVLTASVSIADEIEGRTALTLLSKPLSRRQFVLGKFVGILIPALLMFFILGFVFLGSVSFKTVYDGLEHGRDDVTMAICREEVALIVPGLALSLMQVTVLSAISVAISTRLPMVANMMICLAVFALGRIVPLLVSSSQEQLENVYFIGQLAATVLPVLDHFSMGPAIAGGRVVTFDYLVWAMVYCVLYSTFALLGALVFFEDRDLA